MSERAPAGVPPDLAAALDTLARRRPLLVASDYDGVFAPLVDEPSAATAEPGIAAALTRLAGIEGVVVALVSGRGVDDLRTTSGFTGPYRWIGSHGAEFDGPLEGESAGRRDELRDLLHPVVAGTPGARLEVKPAGVAVHVRQVADRAAGTALLEKVRTLVDPSLTMKPGKDVLELAVVAADKGTALRRLREEVGAAAAIYLGDDRTDEDGFRALAEEDVTVKVGDGETAARYRVPDPASVVVLLHRLADALQATD
jgi:trehalose 6-phosphate phosphatase